MFNSISKNKIKKSKKYSQKKRQCTNVLRLHLRKEVNNSVPQRSEINEQHCNEVPQWNLQKNRHQGWQNQSDPDLGVQKQMCCVPGGKGLWGGRAAPGHGAVCASAAASLCNPALQLVPARPAGRWQTLSACWSFPHPANIRKK